MSLSWIRMTSSTCSTKAHIDKTVEVLTPIVREREEVSKFVPDSVIRKKLRKELKKRHNGRFIAPQQLADSLLTKLVHNVRGGVKAPSGGHSKK